MARIFIFAGFFLCLMGNTLSQNDYIREGRNGLYQIYLGEASFGQEKKAFAKAAKYGFFRPFSIVETGEESPERKNPMFLGPYLGRETAEYVLEKLQKIGYNQAYIEGDEVSLATGKGKLLTHTVQVGAYEFLDARLFASVSNQPAGGVVILYEDGLLKLLAGLYPASSEAYLKEYALKYWKNTLGAEVFVRPFRSPLQD